VARCAEIVRDELAGSARAAERRALRDRLRGDGRLRDITFADIESALDAADDLSAGDRRNDL
jgi:hypothetical protein